MKALSYNWYNSDIGMSVRVCISDKLSPLLPHSHSEMELMYFYSADCVEYLCKGKKIKFSSEELAVINSGEIHACPNWGNRCEAVCLIIDTDIFPKSARKYPKIVNKISDSRIKECFEKIKVLLSDKNINHCETEFKIYSIVYDILAILLHYTDYENICRPNNDIEEVLHYIKENLSDRITLENMAKICNLSKDRFSHIFKEYTGYSPIRFIIKQRIKKACGMLENNNMSIQEIALECGFCTASYFSETFAKYMKTSPLEYRKSIREYTSLLGNN